MRAACHPPVDRKARAGERIAGFALSEPDGGSDIRALRTKAHKVPGGWRINGSKLYITNAAFADVFVSAVEGRQRSQEVINGLRHAATFLRTALASRGELRVFPRLRFHWDPTPEQADHIERLLETIRQEKHDTGPEKTDQPHE